MKKPETVYLDEIWLEAPQKKVDILQKKLCSSAL